MKTYELTIETEKGRKRNPPRVVAQGPAASATDFYNQHLKELIEKTQGWDSSRCTSRQVGGPDSITSTVYPDDQPIKCDKTGEWTAAPAGNANHEFDPDYVPVPTRKTYVPEEEQEARASAAHEAMKALRDYAKIGADKKLLDQLDQMRRQHEEEQLKFRPIGPWTIKLGAKDKFSGAADEIMRQFAKGVRDTEVKLLDEVLGAAGGYPTELRENIESDGTIQKRMTVHCNDGSTRAVRISVDPRGMLIEREVEYHPLGLVLRYRTDP